jgi:hypothetical protein
MSSTMDPLAAVQKYIDSFNRADMNGMAACVATPGSVLDGLPPHAWQGPTAFADWYQDVLAVAEREGATGSFVTLSSPWHANVTGDDAYVVVPATNDVPPARQANHSVRINLYCGASQARCRVGHNSLGMGERHSIALQVPHGI